MRGRNPKVMLGKLDQHFLLKPESRGKPKIYLRVKIGTCLFENDPGKSHWSMGSQTFVNESVKNVKSHHLQKQHWELNSKVSSALPINYSLELDTMQLWDNDDVSEYYLRIGVLCWAVKLETIDIYIEVSIMAACTGKPRKGHLEAAYHIFAYPEQHGRSRLVLMQVAPTTLNSLWWTERTFTRTSKSRFPGTFRNPLVNPSRWLSTLILITPETRSHGDLAL